MPLSMRAWGRGQMGGTTAKEGAAVEVFQWGEVVAEGGLVADVEGVFAEAVGGLRLGVCCSVDFATVRGEEAA